MLGIVVCACAGGTQELFWAAGLSLAYKMYLDRPVVEATKIKMQTKDYSYRMYEIVFVFTYSVM